MEREYRKTRADAGGESTTRRETRYPPRTPGNGIEAAQHWAASSLSLQNQTNARSKTQPIVGALRTKTRGPGIRCGEGLATEGGQGAACGSLAGRIVPTSAAFLRQLRERHTGLLTVIWDNVPSHRGEVMRDYLRTPQLRLRLVPPRLHADRGMYGLKLV